jgi:hypothetical protein
MLGACTIAKFAHSVTYFQILLDKVLELGDLQFVAGSVHGEYSFTCNSYVLYAFSATSFFFPLPHLLSSE